MYVCIGEVAVNQMVAFGSVKGEMSIRCLSSRFQEGIWTYDSDAQERSLAGHINQYYFC